jgi:predicted nicotinamide N-methyase
MESSPTPPPELILPRRGERVRERVIVEGREFLIERPEQSDHLLDVPGVQAAFAVDEYMPYWAEIWPAARMLAKVLVRQPLTPGQQVLELGCGLGLAGIVALSQGLRVVFSDYDLCALRFAETNARLNGLSDFETRAFDWRYPPDDLRVPIVLAADLIYEVRSVEPVVRCIKTVLLPEGTCLLVDQDRIPAETFRRALTAEGLAFTTELVRAGEPGGRRHKGTLYRIRHQSPTR